MYLQYLAACIVSGVASTSIGTVLGFSAILLPQLDDEGLLNSKSPEASWIGKVFTCYAAILDTYFLVLYFMGITSSGKSPVKGLYLTTDRENCVKRRKRRVLKFTKKVSFFHVFYFRSKTARKFKNGYFQIFEFLARKFKYDQFFEYLSELWARKFKNDFFFQILSMLALKFKND